MKKSSFYSLFAAGGLALASSASASVVATSGAGEFSGTQGQDGWSYGYWDVTASPGAYDSSKFTPFLGGSASGVWSDTNHWTGGAWDYNPIGAGVGNPPWTVITPTSMHPNDSVPGAEHYAVLRYTVEAGSGSTINITGSFNNVSANGDGTTGRIFLNGAEEYAALTDGTTDNLGGGVSLTGVNTGDFIDFMVDTGPADADGNDGTNYQFTIARVPEPSSIVLLLGGFAFALRRRR